VINEILEGNLLTPARLEETMKKTKFIKRLLNFFMPSKQLFINMEWVRTTLYYELVYLDRKRKIFTMLGQDIT
jgi:hypothetical protein